MYILLTITLLETLMRTYPWILTEFTTNVMIILLINGSAVENHIYPFLFVPYEFVHLLLLVLMIQIAHGDLTKMTGSFTHIN